MSEHPIEGLMTTAMQSIRDMVDVNTIVGDAVEAPDGTVIIPISRVAFGFAAGGGEYSSSCSEDSKSEDGDEEGAKKSKYPFAGGSGAGVSINPIAFMVVGNGQMKLMPVSMNTSLEKVLDMVPEIVDKINDTIKKKIPIKKEIKGGNGSKHETDKESEE